jgi:hypothetical protein
MAVSVLAVVVDCRDSASLARRWADVLDRRMSERNPGEYEVAEPSRRATPLYFMNVPELKSRKNRVHIDITTDAPLEEEVARLVAVGATVVELRQDPPTQANPDTWAVMRNPEGNALCVFNFDIVTGLI